MFSGPKRVLLVSGPDCVLGCQKGGSPGKGAYLSQTRFVDAKNRGPPGKGAYLSQTGCFWGFKGVKQVDLGTPNGA